MKCYLFPEAECKKLMWRWLKGFGFAEGVVHCISRIGRWPKPLVKG